MSAEGRWHLVDGLPMFARAWPGRSEDAPVVVLVHGAAVSSRNMIPTGEALSGDLHVWAPDLPGHGRSGDPARVLDAAGLSDALAAWMDVAGIGMASLLGNSFGCQIIAHFTLRHRDKIRRAVLQGPTVDPHGRGAVRQLSRWLLNSVREGATQPNVTFGDWYRAGLRGFIFTLRYMGKDRIEERLPDMDVPTLVVRGERDPIVPQRWAEQAASLLPQGRLEVIAGETHTLVFAAPDKLAATVRPFLLDGHSSVGER